MMLDCPILFGRQFNGVLKPTRLILTTGRLTGLVFD